MVEYLGTEVLGAGFGLLGDESNTICSFKANNFLKTWFVVDLYNSNPRIIKISRIYEALSCTNCF